MKKILLIFIFTFCLFPNKAFANRGCCSWHGGISHCGSNGYYICNDGTQSPSCTCYSYDNSYELTDSCYCSYDQNDIDNLNSKINTLEDEVALAKNETEEITNSLDNYKFLFWGTLITFVIYFYYKNYSK